MGCADKYWWAVGAVFPVIFIFPGFLYHVNSPSLVKTLVCSTQSPMPLDTQRMTPRMRLSGSESATRSGVTTKSPGLGQLSCTKAPKLRDSCDACAAAKIRCTRQKPTCSRCEKRKLNCEYTATKRAGRPSQALTKGVAKGVDHMDAPSPNDALPSPLSEVDATSPKEGLLSSPAFVESSPEQQQMTMYEDSIPNVLASTYPASAPSSTPPSLTTFNNEFDDFFASFRSLPERNISAQETLPYSPSHAMECRDSAFMSEDTFLSGDDSWSGMYNLPTGQPSSIGNVENFFPHCSDPPCGCLATAQGFLQELVPNASKARAHLGNQTVEDTQALFPVIRSVIAENERMVEAMDNILQCDCSRDGYLLTVLSIVVFKVLDLYATAAQAARTVMTADRYMSRQSVGSLFVENEGSGRVAAQMVLGELHRAQRLVNTFSARFKVHAMGGSGVENLASSNINAMEMPCDREGMWPFSTTVLYQLEADLRWRLRTVSSRLVDILRHG